MAVGFLFLFAADGLLCADKDQAKSRQIFNSSLINSLFWRIMAIQAPKPFGGVGFEG